MFLKIFWIQNHWACWLLRCWIECFQESVGSLWVSGTPHSVDKLFISHLTHLPWILKDLFVPQCVQMIYLHVRLGNPGYWEVFTLLSPNTHQALQPINSIRLSVSSGLPINSHLRFFPTENFKCCFSLSSPSSSFGDTFFSQYCRWSKCSLIDGCSTGRF